MTLTQRKHNQMTDSSDCLDRANNNPIIKDDLGIVEDEFDDLQSLFQVIYHTKLLLSESSL